MDNLGIFKLLNSFFNFYQNLKSENSQSSSQENSPSFSFDKIFGAEKSKATKIEKTARPASAPNTPPQKPPLQEGMLSLIRSHDEFVKRVQKNSNKKS